MKIKPTLDGFSGEIINSLNMSVTLIKPLDFAIPTIKIRQIQY